jgi:hypothetical protein
MSSVSTEKLGVNGEVVGRIVRTGAGPLGMTWLWSLATRRDGQVPVLDYEAPMMPEAFALSWRRNGWKCGAMNCANCRVFARWSRKSGKERQRCGGLAGFGS